MGFKIVFTDPAITDLGELVGFISRSNARASERLGYGMNTKLNGRKQIVQSVRIKFRGDGKILF